MSDKQILNLKSGRVIADPSKDKVNVQVVEGKRIDDFLETTRLPRRFR